MRPEPNVTVRLCTIECDFAHPLDESIHAQNIKFVDDIRGWHEKCDRLYIWDYIIDYAHSVMPWPNLYVLKPNIRFFIDSGVKGLYEEACYFTRGSELAELRTWIIAKVMWARPDLNCYLMGCQFISPGDAEEFRKVVEHDLDATDKNDADLVASNDFATPPGVWAACTLVYTWSVFNASGILAYI